MLSYKKLLFRVKKEVLLIREVNIWQFTVVTPSVQICFTEIHLNIAKQRHLCTLFCPSGLAQFTYHQGLSLSSLLLYSDFAQCAVSLHKPAEQSIHSNKPAENQLLFLVQLCPLRLSSCALLRFYWINNILRLLGSLRRQRMCLLSKIWTPRTNQKSY